MRRRDFITLRGGVVAHYRLKYADEAIIAIRPLNVERDELALLGIRRNGHDADQT